MGKSVGMPRRLRRNEQSRWVTYRGWLPTTGTLGDGGSHATCTFGCVCVCVCAHACARRDRTGGKCPVAWAAGVLDQRSRRAVGIRARFRYDFGSRCGVREPSFSSSIESAPGLRQLSAVLFLLVEAWLTYTNDWPANTRGGPKLNL